MAGGRSKQSPATGGGYAARNPDYAGQLADTPDYGTPNSAFAAPDLRSDAPYTDTFGWGPKTRISVSGTPDAMRELEFPVRQDGPTGGTPPRRYWRKRDADEAQRESVTELDANGWEITKNQYHVGRNPRETPPPETRWTEKLSPANWSFTRPFDRNSKGNGARSLNGMHFSMADHRRDYTIGGMRPWRQSRNTYRMDPSPWDADMYDVPPTETQNVTNQARYQAPSGPQEYGPTRSYRLG